MDIPFKPIRLEDKEIITSFTFPAIIAIVISHSRTCAVGVSYMTVNSLSWMAIY